MVAQLEANGGILDQGAAAWDIFYHPDMGEYAYQSDIGGIRIRSDVLEIFRRLTSGRVKWNFGAKQWYTVKGRS